MANIGNENIINEFKDAYGRDKDKKVLKTFSPDEQLSIISLKRRTMQNDKFNDIDLELMMIYTEAVEDEELKSSDEEETSDEEEGHTKKRKAKGISKKQKKSKSKKQKAKKSKKLRKIKKKSKTFRRFA